MWWENTLEPWPIIEGCEMSEKWLRLSGYKLSCQLGDLLLIASVQKF